MLPPRAYFFIGLNAIRALSIISMLLVFASSIFVLVKDVEAVNSFMKDSSDEDLLNCDYIENSTVPNQPAGVFWAVVNRLLIIFQIIALIASEVGWPMRFFDRFFPVLGSNFGLGPLGIFQGLIAASILSHHVDDFTLVAGFFMFSLGCVNMLLGLIFRENAKAKRSITSWKEQAKGVLPKTHDLRPQFARPQSGFVSSFFTGSSEKTKVADPESNTTSGLGFGRRAEKQAGLKGFLISRPVEALPPGYVPPSRNVDAESRSSRSSSPEPRFKSSTTVL
ncbi:hypothetical protein EUX98_g3058 [Antrodiella citrinella]|uniref:DUF7598 domain-containing protein n=1 Tax=Antrodiella citrinella TaxID=2447956 RepID=A0A4S4MXI7_9APHY|nr:hypothetical protein EUX98_g3058 [Antrodiella citrinella]